MFDVKTESPKTAKQKIVNRAGSPARAHGDAAAEFDTLWLRR